MKILESIPTFDSKSDVSTRGAVVSSSLDNLSNVSSETLIKIAEQSVHYEVSSEIPHALNKAWYRLFRLTYSGCLEIYLSLLDKDRQVVEAANIGLVYNKTNDSYFIDIDTPNTNSHLIYVSLELRKIEDFIYVYLNTTGLTSSELKYYKANPYVRDELRFKEIYEELGEEPTEELLISEYLIPTSSTLLVYQSSENSQVVIPSNASGSYDYPLINNHPFTGERIVLSEDGSIDNTLRHITITAQHSGPSLLEAGEHGWDVLSNYSRPGSTIMSPSELQRPGLESAGLVRVSPSPQHPTYSGQISEVENVVRELSGRDIITGYTLKRLLYPLVIQAQGISVTSGNYPDIYYLTYLKGNLDSRILEVPAEGTDSLVTEYTFKFEVHGFGYRLSEDEREGYTEQELDLTHWTSLTFTTPDLGVYVSGFTIENGVVTATLMVDANATGSELCRTLTVSAVEKSQNMSPLTFYVYQKANENEVHGCRVKIGNGDEVFYSDSVLLKGIELRVDDVDYSVTSPITVTFTPGYMKLKRFIPISIPYMTATIEDLTDHLMQTSGETFRDEEVLSKTDTGSWTISFYPQTTGDEEADTTNSVVNLYRDENKLPSGKFNLTIGRVKPYLSVTHGGEDISNRFYPANKTKTYQTLEANNSKVYQFIIDSNDIWGISRVYPSSEVGLQYSETIDASCLNPGEQAKEIIEDFEESYGVTLGSVKFYKGPGIVSLGFSNNYSTELDTNPIQIGYVVYLVNPKGERNYIFFNITQAGNIAYQPLIFTTEGDTTGTDIIKLLSKSFYKKFPPVVSIVPPSDNYGGESFYTPGDHEKESDFSRSLEFSTLVQEEHEDNIISYNPTPAIRAQGGWRSYRGFFNTNAWGKLNVLNEENNNELGYTTSIKPFNSLYVGYTSNVYDFLGISHGDQTYTFSFDSSQTESVKLKLHRSSGDLYGASPRRSKYRCVGAGFAAPTKTPMLGGSTLTSFQSAPKDGGELKINPYVWGITDEVMMKNDYIKFPASYLDTWKVNSETVENRFQDWGKKDIGSIYHHSDKYGSNEVYVKSAGYLTIMPTVDWIRFKRPSTLGKGEFISTSGYSVPRVFFQETKKSDTWYPIPETILHPFYVWSLDEKMTPYEMARYLPYFITPEQFLFDLGTGLTTSYNKNPNLTRYNSNILIFETASYRRVDVIVSKPGANFMGQEDIEAIPLTLDIEPNTTGTPRTGSIDILCFDPDNLDGGSVTYEDKDYRDSVIARLYIIQPA